MLASTLLMNSQKEYRDNNIEIKEKKHVMKGQDCKQRTSEYKAFKSKIEGLQDEVFESRTMKYATV